MATELSDRQILEQLGVVLVSGLKENVPKATGTTADAITKEVSDTRLEIWAPAYIGALEHGRKPTGAGASSTGQTLVERLKNWIEAKGINLGQRAVYDAEKALNAVAWAMATSIHKHGTRLYQAGGKSGVISNVITDERINETLRIFADKYANQIGTIVFKSVE